MKVKPIGYYEDWAQKFTKDTWGMILNVPVLEGSRRARRRRGCLRISGTLDRTGAVDILLYLHLMDTHEVVLDVLKHELCHWYCYVSGLNYHDGDVDFERELKRTGAPSTRTQTRAHSNVIQDAIVSGRMTRDGIEGTRYTSVSSDMVYAQLPESKPELYEKLKQWGALDQIERTQAVYYKGVCVGHLFKYNGKYLTLTHYEGDEQLTCYRTRKQASIRMVSAYLSGEMTYNQKVV